MRALRVGRGALAALLVCGLTTIGGIPISGAATGPYDAVFVFGDSLSDSGNVFTYTSVSPLPGVPYAIPPAPYYNGRFTNGPNYADLLTGKLGLGPLTPSNLGGTNYAWGGASTGAAIVPGLPVPSILQQIGMFGQTYSQVADPNALYILWGGGNDLRDVVTLAQQNPSNAFSVGSAAIDSAVANLHTALLDLQQMGATHVLVPNVPNLAAAPETGYADTNPSFDLRGYASGLTGAFNAKLDDMLDTFSGLSIMKLDAYSMFNAILHNPGNYGFTDTVHQCYTGGIFGGGTTCGAPDQFVFWDDHHPTAAVEKILANAAFAVAVPEPETVVMLALGLLILGFQVRGRDRKG